MEQIIKTGLIELKNDFKIYWGKFPIAKLNPGKDYLNPEINLIIDDMIENTDKIKLNTFLNNWIIKKIHQELSNLIDLKFLKQNNSQIRALAYHLYENNGVVKREEVLDFLNKLGQDERKVLRNLGVKFGRYHIFLFKLFKPNAVSIRILLWKNYHQKYFKLAPPTFGLNFVKENQSDNKSFMLLCGFEKFDKFFVRIDILERLFIMIMNANTENNKEIKLTSEMLNLLGCSKDDFVKLIESMNYKSIRKNDKIFFKYMPKKFKKKNKFKESKKDNPFYVLNQLSIK